MQTTSRRYTHTHPLNARGAWVCIDAGREERRGRRPLPLPQTDKMLSFTTQAVTREAEKAAEAHLAFKSLSSSSSFFSRLPMSSRRRVRNV